MASLIQPLIDQIISNTLTAYTLKLTILKHIQDISLDSSLSQDDITFLVTEVSQFLTDTSNVDLLTLKLQSAFIDVQKEAQFDYSSKTSQRDRNLVNLRESISAISSGDTMQAYSLLLQYAMTYQNKKLGTNPTDDSDVKWSRSSPSPPSARVSQLNELAEIVQGICLLNSRQVILDQNKSVFADLIQFSQRLLHDVTTTINSSLTFFSSINSNSSNNGGIDRLIKEHVFCSQYLRYLEGLKLDIESVRRTVSEGFSSFQSEIATIVDLIGKKASVPKKDVYPRFISLSRGFNVIVNERYGLNSGALTLKRLDDIFKNFNSLLDQDDVDCVKTPEETLKNDRNLEYDPEFGCLVKRGSEESDRKSHAKSLIFDRPSLVYYIGSDLLFDGDSPVSMDDELSKGSLKSVIDQDAQTPVHFVEKNIDYNYDFSEWKLRQKALKLTNLLSKKTHSSQTTECSFKKTAETQVYVPKVNGSQTTVDESTNTAQQKVFHHGLVGRPF
ncbi:hypothetical protein GEMRC1_009258 [Eukaryota sp. GEM-RC1]